MTENKVTNKFSFIECATKSVALVCIIANRFIDNGIIGWSLVGISLASLATAPIVRWAKMRNALCIGSIVRHFRKIGMHPFMTGNEIVWNFRGKENILRLVNGNHLQIFREYPVQPEMICDISSAATVTMKQVFSAKVGILGDEGDENLVFSTEFLCSSMKEFAKILPESVNILDDAEDRQMKNVEELVSGGRNSHRRIGYLV